MICHKLFPNADAICPNFAPNASTFSGSNVAPVNVPTAYFKIQPITTVYPIAIARDPITGIIPSASPLFLLPLFSHAIPNASIGPDFAALPKLISPITPVEPIKITNRKYGIRKDPPPYSDTLVGNIQILPIPTAEPMQAQINPHLLLNDSLLFIPHSLIRALLCTEHLSGINFVIRCCCTDFFIPFLRIYILYRN